jgi:hypothetical protein
MKDNLGKINLWRKISTVNYALIFIILTVDFIAVEKSIIVNNIFLIIMSITLLIFILTEIKIYSLK